MSVVVVGLQHKQAPLSLLEAVAIGDADLHKVLSELRHRRNIHETVVLSTCLRTEVYAVVDRFHDAVAEVYDVLSEHSGYRDRRAGRTGHRPVRRRRHDPPVLGDLGPGVHRDRGERSGRPGPPGLRVRPGRRGERPGAVRPVPACAADRQAGAHRHRHLPGHDVVCLRRRAGGPGRRRQRPARQAGGGGRCRRNGCRGQSSPVRHSATRMPRSSIVVVNRSLDRAEELVQAAGRDQAPGGAARRACTPSWPGPTWC